eukprot:TRINITY_DN16491_c0_g1_i1.p2 TRINITY_DN16491_c0_g1~~TRINITY_DN16491_c0_g1_i1.p2  ORF type:complete len:237 (+),score=72.12 TRINITY_DN16491_c0_g1_i1:58-711(+)
MQRSASAPPQAAARRALGAGATPSAAALALCGAVSVLVGVAAFRGVGAGAIRVARLAAMPADELHRERIRLQQRLDWLERQEGQQAFSAADAAALAAAVKAAAALEQKAAAAQLGGSDRAWLGDAAEAAALLAAKERSDAVAAAAERQHRLRGMAEELRRRSAAAARPAIAALEAASTAAGLAPLPAASPGFDAGGGASAPHPLPSAPHRRRGRPRG